MTKAGENIGLTDGADGGGCVRPVVPSSTGISRGELREHVLDGRRLYDGRVVALRVDRVLFPSGKEGRREVVEHAPAVAILAETEEGRLLLVRQYRHPVGGEILEIPAGIVEDGEDPADTAARELREETGYASRRIDPVARFYTSPGFCDEEIWLYYATELTLSPLPQDEDEFIRLESVDRGDLPELLASSRIRDGKTLLALWWYAATHRP